MAKLSKEQHNVLHLVMTESEKILGREIVRNRMASFRENGLPELAYEKINDLWQV